MDVNLDFLLYFFNLIFLTHCYYPPIGDEIQQGSVLLPASRRGRYLANIIRRQAVDGTGIKFNKDADRLNAEAKKKVDVLSEELLPYIIAEQERRTTLHKRVMTAIQNGEKGVTIAEIRNKPPLLIRKGLMYRCPSNRAPKEPDGTGVLMCEDDIVPTQVMYDSCLSAEDRELYNAENKYFFCNRHKVEGPDLPHNGSSVIGCAPIERTSLNYTASKCTLEETDDIVVHYRYYPDRTYKFVTELDPDREVCDHWNPCQIGYIYSLPSTDQATPATELWHDVQEKPEDYERDEIVPPVPEDSEVENVPTGAKTYHSSPRKVPVPEGARRSGLANFVGVILRTATNLIKKITSKHFTFHMASDSSFISISLIFDNWRPSFFGEYDAVFSVNGNDVHRKFLNLAQSTVNVIPQTVQYTSGERLNSSLIPYKCNRCRLISIMVRSVDDNIYNVDPERYRVKNYDYRQQYIEVSLDDLTPKEIGDYFAIIQNGDGIEERIRILTVEFKSAPPETGPSLDSEVNAKTSPPESGSSLDTEENEIDTSGAVRIPEMRDGLEVGQKFEKKLTYQCDGCSLTDVTCNGKSVLSAGKVSIDSASPAVNFNIPSFQDTDACVYMGSFKMKDDKVTKKVLGVIDNIVADLLLVKRIYHGEPEQGKYFLTNVTFTCNDCNVEKVYLNGVPLEKSDIKSSGGKKVFYEVTTKNVLIHIMEYHSTYSGVYQCVFRSGDKTMTRTLLDIRSSADGTPGSPGQNAETPQEPQIPETDAPHDEKPAADKDNEQHPASDAPADAATSEASEATEAPAEQAERRNQGTTPHNSTHSKAPN